MNTYLLYCNFKKMRAGLLALEYEQERALVKDILGNLSQLEPHWDKYLKAWA